jgi:hypothetical protein
MPSEKSGNFDCLHNTLQIQECFGGVFPTIEKPLQASKYKIFSFFPSPLSSFRTPSVAREMEKVMENATKQQHRG